MARQRAFYACGSASLRAIASSLASIARRSARSSSLGITMFAILHRWRLARQRKHLVHSDAGPDCGIAQPGFANRFGHSFAPQRGYVS